MPLIGFILLAAFLGGLTAVVGRHELRANPRSVFLSKSFYALLLFGVFSLAPAALFFYLFHGDWFLTYLVRATAVPSALTLIGSVLLICVAAGSFAIGAHLVRQNRGFAAGLLLALIALIGVATLMVVGKRFALVGTFEQFHKNFGLEKYNDHSILLSAIVICALVCASYTATAIRLYVGTKGQAQQP